MQDRENLFLAAFGKTEPAKSPVPHKGQTWRFDMAKVATLSFDEKYNLVNFDGVPYRDLPAWIRDGGYIIASQEEKKYQKDALIETGLNQSERNAVFNAAQADAEALVAMTTSELLRNSVVLDGEISRLQARYGAELIAMVGDLDPEAASYIHARHQLKQAEQRATQEQESASSEASVRAEIQAAKEAIAAQNDGAKSLSDEALKNELTRRASMAAHQAAEAGE